MGQGWVWRRAVIGIFILSQMLSVYAWPGTTSLGTARGTRAVSLSLGEGKAWLSLAGRSYPVMPGMQIRSTTGRAAVELVDGSRVNVLPFSAIRFQEAEGAIDILLLHGRLIFEFPAETRVEISTPSARLAPVRQAAMAGEVFVKSTGQVGLKMTRGTLEVHQFTDPTQVMLASTDPIFVPQRPVGQGFLFTSDTVIAPPTGAKGTFSPKGKSIGYLQPDGQFIVQPGFTADLTQPFAARLVRMAMATIPDSSASDAMPLFDVNGKYLGYLRESAFYPETQVAQAMGRGAAGGGSGSTEIIAGGLLVGTWGLLIGLGIGGVFSGDTPRPATAIQPGR
ncbi:MAG TPA: FecR domain-containing protein [Candidatus Tectomicrobia bacterium]|nr:FecR domain-containing protein [Candidatus Tectomicrobia bacterium]